jgi:hypothetical protein
VGGRETFLGFRTKVYAFSVAFRETKKKRAKAGQEEDFRDVVFLSSSFLGILDEARKKRRRNAKCSFEGNDLIKEMEHFLVMLDEKAASGFYRILGEAEPPSPAPFFLLLCETP